MPERVTGDMEPKIEPANGAFESAPESVAPSSGVRAFFKETIDNPQEDFHTFIQNFPGKKRRLKTIPKKLLNKGKHVKPHKIFTELWLLKKSPRLALIGLTPSVKNTAICDLFTKPHKRKTIYHGGDYEIYVATLKDWFEDTNISSPQQTSNTPLPENKYSKGGRKVGFAFPE